MSPIVGIVTFMSMINFMLSLVEHDKSFITLGPGYLLSQLTQFTQLIPFITVGKMAPLVI